jgi:hypothetical protein
MVTIVIVVRVTMAMSNNRVTEDLAIQETLSMTVEERLELLAALIADRIARDQKVGEPLFQKFGRLPRA